jgi:hypothetical protein
VHGAAEAGLGEALEHLGVGGRTHDHERDRPVGTLAQLQPTLDDALAREVGKPRVAEAQDAIGDRLARPSHEHRRAGPLGRLGVGPDALEAHVLAVVAGLVLGPDRPHRLDALGHDRHPQARVGAVVAHLLAVPARADAELEPPAGEMVDRGDFLGGDDRVALHDEADPAADPQPRRAHHGRRHRDEEVQGVDVASRQGAVADRERRLAARGDVRVLGEEERLVATLLDQAGERSRIDGVVRREHRDAGLQRQASTDTVVRTPGAQ